MVIAQSDSRAWPLRHAAAPYAVALATALAAVALSLWFGTSLRHGTFAFLYPAAAIAAWFGGLAPGLLVSILGAAAAYLLTSPAGPYSGNPTGVALVLSLVVLACGATVSYIVSTLRADCRRAVQERVDANSFAAKLHLQLMLAEGEIERLRIALRDQTTPARVVPDREVIRDVPLGDDDTA